MIRLENVATACFESTSLEMRSGLVCKLITSSDHEKRVLLDTILAVKRPVSGKVFLFERDIWAVSKRDVLKILRKIGMVWSYGGLISNLKVWENITLPVWYHTAKRPEDLEGRVVQIFKELGKDVAGLDYMGKLPGPLPVTEKRLIGVVRAILMEPEIMIYDALLEGLDSEMAERLLMLTTGFHSGRVGRTSLYVSSDEESLKGLKADITIRQDGRGFTVWES